MAPAVGRLLDAELLESGFHRAACAEEADLDRLVRLAEGFGDRLGRLALAVVEVEDLALGFRDLVLEDVRTGVEDHGRLDPTIRTGLGRDRGLRLELLHRHADRRLLAEAATELVMRDAEHPGEQRRAALPRTDASMDLEEGVLHDVLGFGGVAQALHGEAVEPLCIEVVQRLEGLRIAGLDRVHELTIQTAALCGRGVDGAACDEGQHLGGGLGGVQGLGVRGALGRRGRVHRIFLSRMAAGTRWAA